MHYLLDKLNQFAIWLYDRTRFPGSETFSALEIQASNCKFYQKIFKDQSTSLVELATALAQAEDDYKALKYAKGVKALSPKAGTRKSSPRKPKKQA
jgi:hypothetical protein